MCLKSSGITVSNVNGKTSKEKTASFCKTICVLRTIILVQNRDKNLIGLRKRKAIWKTKYINIPNVGDKPKKKMGQYMKSDEREVPSPDLESAFCHVVLCCVVL